MYQFGLLLAIALLLFTGTAEASQQGITVLNGKSGGGLRE